MLDKNLLDQLKNQSDKKRKAYRFASILNAQVKKIDNLNFGSRPKTIINLRIKLNPDQILNAYPVIDRSKLNALKSKIENKYKIQLNDQSKPKKLEFGEIPELLTNEPKFLTYSSLNMPQTTVYTSPNFNGSIFYNPIFNKHLQLRLVTSLALIAFIVFSTGLFFSSMPTNFDPGNLATADQKSSLTSTELKQAAYKSWIESYNYGQYSPPEKDLDNDGLTNYEEFLITSNPMTPFSCNAKITDVQNLSNLINPNSCKAIDLTNPEEINKFREVITIPEINIEIDKPNPNKVKTIENSQKNSSESTNMTKQQEYSFATKD